MFEGTRRIVGGISPTKIAEVALSSYPVLQPNEFMLMQGMTDQQKMIFMSQFTAARKDTTVAVLLALFLGGFGAHHFYMGNIGVGVLYAVFFWTFIPAFIAFVECFLMPNRVRRYNSIQANILAAQVRAAFPA